MVILDPGAALPDLLLANATVSPDAIGYSRFDGSQWTDISNEQFWNQVQQLARGFIAAGIKAGDCVGIMSRTRYEWTLVDFALWTAGAIPVPIYDSSSADQVHWILSDSGAVACIVETPRNAKTVDQAIADLANVKQVWCITDNDLDTLAARGDEVPKEVLDQRRASLNVDSLATIIYTSGTTGRPKGCELTHGNFLACAQNAVAAMPDVVGVKGASTLLFLPLAHVFARFVEVMCVAANVRLAHTATITDLAGKLQSFQPTFLLAVPRVFEKLYVGAQQKATADGKGAIFQRATDVAIAYSQGIQTGRIPFAVKTQHAVFEKLVYSKLRNAMGGQIRWAVSGGAPLGERLGHFFRGAGVTILEGYGLTETTAPHTVNTPSMIKVGSVGKPLPGCSIRIADDGEVLVKGPNVFRSYLGDPSDTEAAFVDGWYRTGDIGTLDDGYLYITGRKKEIIITAGGKNVAPAPLEALLASNPLVAHAVVIGDNRPYIATLLTLDPDELKTWLTKNDRVELSAAELVNDPQLRAALQKNLDLANKTVSAAEGIRRFVILPVEFTEETGYLTPKLSVKRHLVLADFAEQVESLY
jgi:long-chain acyl-CoA synthetase